MNKNQKFRASLIILVLSAALLSAGGTREIPTPVITLDLAETTWISPGNVDGIKDSVSWTVSIAAAERMVVKGYRVIVTNEAGGETYRFEESYPGEQPFFERLFIGVGFARLKKPVTVPGKLEWKGERTDGTGAPEGAYTLRVEGWDDKGRTGSSGRYRIVVDNTPPRADFAIPYPVFSPNADGNKDILIIEQIGSTEALWTGELVDSTGAVVYALAWNNGPPENIIWDGVGSSGSIVADGSYRYRLSSTDQAGNSFSIESDELVVDTKDTPIALTRNVSFFSPNDDGATDTVLFTFEVPITEGIREWTFDVLDGTGTVRRTIKGFSIPPSLEFDGKNAAGVVLPEGTYRARLQVLYINGNSPVATSAEFTIDLKPPVVSVKAFPLVFSPNGDGRKDTVQIYQETSLEDVWTGILSGPTGNVVRRFDWRGRAESTITWDGRNDANELVPDGLYRYVLSSRDRAGNYAEAATEPIRVDTRATPIALSTDVTWFSPNGDGVKDTVTFLPAISDPVGVTRLSLSITDENATPVRTFLQTAATDRIVWDGRNEVNQAAANGSYLAELAVEYEHGNAPSVRIGPIVIDRIAPTATVSADRTIFSPDGDGNQDEVTITQSGVSTEDEWTGTFTNEAGRAVLTRKWAGTATSFVWGGTDQDGNLLPDGNYRYTLESTDRAGNTGRFVINRITIDTRDTPVTLRIGSSAFSPNGDGVKDTLVITPGLEVTDNIESYRVEIRNAAGTPVRLYTGSTTVPPAIEFDGKGDDGKLLPEAGYTARISVLYRNGNRPSATSPAFTIDNTKPRATVSAEYALFSPNGDGRKDTIAITQSGTEEESWRGIIVNASNQVVRSYSFIGRLEARLVWDGKDDSGRTVPDGQYRYTVSATDRAGNTGQSDAARFRVDNRRTSISLAADPGFFSPNGDGIQDSLRITPTVSLNEEIESHVLEILDGSGAVVRSFEGSGAVPARVTWNGNRSNGTVAPDGSYTARMTIVYAKGDRPQAQAGPFVIDTTAPTARIAAAVTLFSPDGDGRKDEITITQTTSVEDLWEATITRIADGEVVRTIYWSAGAAASFIWQGRDDNRTVVSDGDYRYELTSTDKAGNSVSAVIPRITVDNRPVSAFVSASAAAFSPNGDGRHDTVRFNLYTNPSDGIESWSLLVRDAAGRTVRNLTRGSQTAVPSTIDWDGRSDGGRVNDGSYTPRLAVTWQKGNTVEVDASRAVLIDVSGPSFGVQIAPTPFSPDDDGENDTVRISLVSVNDASPIAAWDVSILDPYGSVFYRRTGTGNPPASITWDGYSASGELVQAAEDYRVTAKITDALGNVGERSEPLPVDVLVIREGDILKIRISSIQFAPNSADFLEFDPEKAERNLKTLARLAEILKKYSQYQIRIEGHAVSVDWNDAARAKREETEELQPLSQARADAVKTALVSLGIPEARMTTEGMGGTQPVVPHGDLENRWKSRRVEFILVR